MYGPLFEVEVHDRDRVIHKFEEGNSLFGEERDDDLLSVPNPGSLFLACFVYCVCLVCKGTEEQKVEDQGQHSRCPKTSQNDVYQLVLDLPTPNG